jgi:hypothetical protein
MMANHLTFGSDLPILYLPQKEFSMVWTANKVREELPSVTVICPDGLKYAGRLCNRSDPKWGKIRAGTAWEWSGEWTWDNIARMLNEGKTFKIDWR